MNEILTLMVAAAFGALAGYAGTALYYRSVLKSALNWAGKVYLDAVTDRDFYKSLVEGNHEN